MRILASLLLLCSIGCAKPPLPSTDQCGFQPGDTVRLSSTGEVGQVVAVHRWGSRQCQNDVLLGDWIVEDIPYGQLVHVEQE